MSILTNGGMGRDEETQTTRTEATDNIDVLVRRSGRRKT
jgi:hypothetical protein